MNKPTGDVLPAERLRVKTDDHQYEVVQDVGGAIRTTRFDEPCRGNARDGLILGLARDLDAARIYMAELEETVKGLKAQLEKGGSPDLSGEIADPFDAPGMGADDTPSPRM